MPNPRAPNPWLMLGDVLAVRDWLRAHAGPFRRVRAWLWVGMILFLGGAKLGVRDAQDLGACIVIASLVWVVYYLTRD